MRRSPRSPLFPYTTLFRSDSTCYAHPREVAGRNLAPHGTWPPLGTSSTDRKSTRLNSSHTVISYAVFCLKKKIATSTSLSSHTKTKQHAIETTPFAHSRRE